MTLEIALIRWSVIHLRWNELASDMPNLGAFLAGWYMRCNEATMPERKDFGKFPDSFRVGWREADEQLTILAQQGK